MKEKTFIVLGASGFIGRCLVEYLSLRQVKVIAASRTEIVEQKQNIQYVKLNKYQDMEFCENSTVFHLAETHHIKEVEEKGISYIDEVVDLTQKLLEKKPARFIYASSTAVYDDMQMSPCMPHSQLPLGGKSIYAQSKQFVERIVLDHNGVVARLTNTYGHGMSKLNIFSTIIAQLNNQNILLNEASPMRDYIWIEDLVDGLYKVSIGSQAGIFNIATGNSISCEDLCQLILKITNKSHLEVKFKLPPRKSALHIDIRKTQETFGWHPATTLLEGIKKIIGSKI